MKGMPIQGRESRCFSKQFTLDLLIKMCLLSNCTWNGLLLEASLRRLFGSVHTLSAIN